MISKPKKNIKEAPLTKDMIAGHHLAAIAILRQTYESLSDKSPAALNAFEASVKTAIENVYSGPGSKDPYTVQFLIDEVLKIFFKKSDWEIKEEELYELFSQVIFLRVWHDKFKDFFKNMEDVVASTIQLDFSKRVELTAIMKDQNNWMNYGAVFLNMISEKMNTSVVSTKAVNAMLPTGIISIVSDKDGNIRFINELGEKLLGIQNGDFIGKSIFPFFLDYKEIEKSLKKGSDVKNMPVNLVVPGNTKLISAFLTIPKIKENISEVSEIVYTIETDVNKKKELEFSITKEAHDKLAPLHSLSGLSNLFKRKFVDPESQEMLSMLDSSLNRMIENAQETLRKMISTDTPVQIEAIYFSYIINEILDTLRYTEGFSEMHFIEDVKYEGIFENDIKLIRSILLNFITNAIKYRDKKKAEPSLQIIVRRNGNEMQLTIKDNGLGISKKDQKKLFEKGVRTQSAQTSDAEGHGVGLYLVKQSITKLNGRIEVTSQKGKGTEFNVYLPIN